MDKKELRQRTLKSLNEMTDELYLKSSQIICNKLLSELHLLEGQTIALTISNKPEVDTIRLIEELWKMGNRVVVPKCIKKDRSMFFYKIDNFEQLEIVYMNLREPIVEKTSLVDEKEIDIMIVPGVVFDKQGYRVGFGGGYYDRFLENYNGVKISLAFDVQIVDSVPKEDHDIPVDLLITVNERINCIQNRKGV